MTKVKGYRTYVIAAIVIAAGVLEGLGLITIPSWIWPLLGASGLGFLRASVGNVSKTVSEIKSKGEKK